MSDLRDKRKGILLKSLSIPYVIDDKYVVGNFGSGWCPVAEVVGCNQHSLILHSDPVGYLPVTDLFSVIETKSNALAAFLQIPVEKIEFVFDQIYYESETYFCAAVPLPLLSEEFCTKFSKEEITSWIAEKEIQQEKQKVKIMLPPADLELFKKLLNSTATAEEVMTLIYKAPHIQTMLSFATPEGFKRAIPAFKFSFETYKKFMQENL